MVSHGRTAFFLLAGAIYSDAFSENIVIADFDTCVSALVTQVLGCGSDNDTRVQFIFFAQWHVASEGDVIQ